MIRLTLFPLFTKPRLRTLRVSSCPSGNPGTYVGFCDSSALAAIIADSEIDEGESGMVVIDERRIREIDELWACRVCTCVWGELEEDMALSKPKCALRGNGLVGWWCDRASCGEDCEV